MTVPSARQVPVPKPGEETAWVAEHLGELVTGPVRSGGIRGGQSQADRALAGFDVAGYARRRNEVWPPDRQGASRLSPYIRHGLLDLPRVWNHVEAGPAHDAEAFRSELLWREYARPRYARVGRSTRRSLRFAVEERTDAAPTRWRPDTIGEAVRGEAVRGEGARGMACLDLSVRDLTEQGWLTNQQRMWLASHYSVRERQGWRDGEDEFFRNLLDGSRAANRLGWQWTVGALTGKRYGFSRWQVDKRAPGLCGTCPRESDCPIEQWPDDEPVPPRAIVDPLMRKDPDLPATRGPSQADIHHAPEAVWITAESLGDEDPAVAAWPDIPVVFVFDTMLLTRLRLASHRLVFLTECLSDLATRRDLTVWLGSPRSALAQVPLATTFAPVPGWAAHAPHLHIGALHPWPWLIAPHAGPVTSFTAWRRRAGV